ncbi:MAG TPA: pantoate--beta-alanine ligase [Bacilli bacterium]
MEVIQAIDELRRKLQPYRLLPVADLDRGMVGFVPTMGYLHKGHISLIEAAKKQCRVVVLSIFVNPLQFGPNEDFAKYPRNQQQDLALALKAGVDFVFLPEVSEIYPYYPLNSMIKVSQITSHLCGASRPGHFDGVATVVLKLFNIVQPDYAYFGLKDAQQIGVVEQIVQDFNMTTQIITCPIIRERDGLAMSSRNVYLSLAEREQAVILNTVLKQSKAWVNENGMTYGKLQQRIIESITDTPLARIDYVEILSYPAFEAVAQTALASESQLSIIIAVAVKFGTTRLIDNCILSPGGGEMYV